MRSIVSLAMFLLVLAAVHGLAYASPPDPSWIPGFYDDADYDDVVGLVTSATGHVGPTPLRDLRPILLVVGPAAAGSVDSGHSHPASVVRLRAPPAV